MNNDSLSIGYPKLGQDQGKLFYNETAQFLHILGSSDKNMICPKEDWIRWALLP